MAEVQVKYIVRLTGEERERLEALVKTGKAAAAKRQRAHILLKADAGEYGPNEKDKAIHEGLDVGHSTIHRARQAYVEQGLEAALARKRPSGRHYRKLDGAQEAKLVAIACSPPPHGRKRWTIRLLGDRLIELKVTPAIGRETVRRTLKKTISSRG